jgi:hypothetical protein
MKCSVTYSWLMQMRILLLVASLAVTCLMAQLANKPPVPEWITPPRGAAAKVPLLRTFDWSGKLLKAILLVASASEVEITINGQPAGTITGLEKATSVDVTRLVKGGAQTRSHSAAHLLWPRCWS